MITAAEHSWAEIPTGEIFSLNRVFLNRGMSHSLAWFPVQDSMSFLLAVSFLTNIHLIEVPNMCIHIYIWPQFSVEMNLIFHL